ncbi:MAG: ABC transporter permease, partial [Pseudomonadota bacterium]
MINLARRDIAHHLKSYLLTGLGLGLLIGVTLTMAGVYRGMVDDARVLLRAVDADVWVVQQHTLGPFAEPSSVPDDLYRALAGIEGVGETGNVAYLTMQVAHRGTTQRVMVAGFEPGKPGGPAFLVAGRPIERAHYEAVADAKTGFAVGDVVRIRRNDYTVVGLTRRMVSSGGDPMLFIPLKDAQEAQFLKDNDAIVEDRKRLAANPAVNRPGQPGVLEAV